MLCLAEMVNNLLTISGSHNKTNTLMDYLFNYQAITPGRGAQDRAIQVAEIYRSSLGASGTK